MSSIKLPCYLHEIFERGIPIELFSSPSPISETLICPICTDILLQPVQCLNGHLFCQPCLLKCIERKQECPTCKVRICQRTMSKSLLAQDIIGKMKISCIHSMVAQQSSPKSHSELLCDWTGECQYLPEHLLKDCKAHEFSCPNDGCDGRFQAELFMQHLERCVFLSEKCEYCDDIISSRNYSEHLDICRKFPSICGSGCGLILTREEIDRHRAFCRRYQDVLQAIDDIETDSDEDDLEENAERFQIGQNISFNRYSNNSNANRSLSHDQELGNDQANLARGGVLNSIHRSGVRLRSIFRF